MNRVCQSLGWPEGVPEGMSVPPAHLQGEGVEGVGPQAHDGGLCGGPAVVDAAVTTGGLDGRQHKPRGSRRRLCSY